jgi:hypothetical protein
MIGGDAPDERNKGVSPLKKTDIYGGNIPGTGSIDQIILPDPPSKCHLRCCLRLLVPAVYDLYASVLAPLRLASNTFMVPRDNPKSRIVIGDTRI